MTIRPHHKREEISKQKSALRAYQPRAEIYVNTAHEGLASSNINLSIGFKFYNDRHCESLKN